MEMNKMSKPEFDSFFKAERSTHHHHDIRSDAWRHASGRIILLWTRTKAEKDTDTRHF
jgi:hypothetical protein